MMAEFLAMGGHAVWVWSCYGLTLLGVGVVIALALRQRRKAAHWRALAGASARDLP